MSIKKTLHLVAGARPNFMKIAPIVRALDARRDGFDYRIVHTGQHYDREMSDVFFEELGIPKPDHHLEAGGGSHAEQTAKIMVAYERICQRERPDCTLVVGDVNSTLACSIIAKKLHIPVAHVEAGLRSGDMRMPEEINRLVTDSISDWFFVTEPAGRDNLLREGKREESVFFVGHVMVDNLFYQRDKLPHADRSGFESEALKRRFERYGAVTLHRSSNVDDRKSLADSVDVLREIAARLPPVFPVHPRMRGNLEKFGTLRFNYFLRSQGELFVDRRRRGARVRSTTSMTLFVSGSRRRGEAILEGYGSVPARWRERAGQDAPSDCLSLGLRARRRVVLPNSAGTRGSGP